MFTRKIVRRTCTTAACTVLLGLAGIGSAVADTTLPSAEVDPGTVAVGEGFEVLVDCGPDATGAAVSTTVLGGPSEVTMEQVEGNPGVYFTGITVPSGTEPGTYDLSVTCAPDGSSDMVSITVAPAGAPDTGVAGVDTGIVVALAGIVVAAAATAGIMVARRRRAEAP